MSSSIFDQLVAMFIKFPGIGPRQARRFVYFLLALDEQSLNRFTENISLLKQKARQCDRCGYHFFKDDQGGQLCRLCSDPNRDHSLLMVVEKDLDVDTIKRSDSYPGLFFILGGLVPILDKEPAKRIRLTKLLNLIKTELKSGVLTEIILALSVNSEGDYTIDYLKQHLQLILVDYPNTKISVLGRGLSTGTELEYSDSETLRNALKNRG